MKTLLRPIVPATQAEFRKTCILSQFLPATARIAFENLPHHSRIQRSLLDTVQQKHLGTVQWLAHNDPKFRANTKKTLKDL